MLILDEPTNDLDIQTLRILEDNLDRFAGILIVVSHDRYFLDRVVTRIFAFSGNGNLIRSEGAYTEYLEHMETQGIPSGAAKNTAGAAEERSGACDGKADGSAAEERSGAELYAAQKEEQKKARKRTRLSYRDQQEYDHIEEEIDQLEQKSRELEEQMAESATMYTKLSDLSKEKEAVDAKLEERMERYFELQELVDSFAKTDS